MIFVECFRHRLPQNFTLFDENHKINKREYCTMKNTRQYCNIVRLSRTNKPYIKSPSLIELYQKIFPEAIIPTDLHNSLVDILITMRCYVKLNHNFDITVTNETIRELFIKYKIIS